MNPQEINKIEIEGVDRFVTKGESLDVIWFCRSKFEESYGAATEKPVESVALP